MLFDANDILMPTEYDFNLDMNLLDPSEALKKGNSFRNLYDSYGNYDISMSNPTCKKDELLRKIMKLDFIINDLTLYLDIHPDDKKYFNMFKTYTKKLTKLKEDYSNLFGPLEIDEQKDNYVWSKECFPWEG